MSVASEITRLNGAKADIIQAITDKGVTVPSGAMLDDCPELIRSIPGGGGGEVSERAPILLDYFVDGYRFGIRGTGTDRTSVGVCTDEDASISLGFLDYKTTFPNGMPYGEFNGVAGANNKLVYDLTDKLSTTDGFTIEYYVRAVNPQGGNGYWDVDYAYLGNLSAKVLNVYMEGSYSVKTSYYIKNYATNTTTYIPFYESFMASLPTNALDFSTWIHVSLVFRNNQMFLYINGWPSSRATGQGNNNFSIDKYVLHNCLQNFNNESKNAAYQMAELAIFDYARNVHTNTAPSTLLIDKWPELLSA